MAQSKIDKIDSGLAIYYQDLQRDDYFSKEDGQEVGKFKLYCDENGLEDGEVEDELKDDTDISECILLDFDEGFPFKSGPITDENEKHEKIFEVLTQIMKSADGRYTFPQSQAEAEPVEPLSVELVRNVSDSDISTTADKYLAQMPCLKTIVDKDDDLKLGLAVGDNFIANLVDAYTNDATVYFIENRKTLTVEKWANDNAFMRRLLKMNKKKRDQIASAIKNYGNRIMPRLQFDAARFKINDSLAEIAEYAASIPVFIKGLLNAQKAVPPFQFELVIAVKGVQGIVEEGDEDSDDDDNDDDDDDDDDDEKQPDPAQDQIGNVQREFQQNAVACKVTDADEEAISRNLMLRFQDFRTILEKSAGGGDDGDDEAKGDEDKKKSSFDAASYPHRRRFCIFIDRRKDKAAPKRKQSEADSHYYDRTNLDKEDKRLDLLTFYEPPSDCNEYPDDHVAEIGFQFVRQCMIPRTGDNMKSITALNGVCGQLITFMFNVEAADQIKCYVIWNGQTMRFQGKHMLQVLPSIFDDTKQNKAFRENREQAEKIAKRFDDGVQDIKFERFCDSINVTD